MATKYEYYDLYLYNIHTLINTYGYTYEWLDVGEEDFYNPTGLPYDEPDPDNDFLVEFANDKTGLAKDILEKGTFFPFFYYEKDGKKMITQGKHRIYSLKCLAQEQPLPRKFLFIKHPHNYTEEEHLIERKNKPLYFFERGIEQIKELWVEKEMDVVLVLDSTGDYIPEILHAEGITPSFFLNSEQAFFDFISHDFAPNLTPRYGESDIQKEKLKEDGIPSDPEILGTAE